MPGKYFTPIRRRSIINIVILKQLHVKISQGLRPDFLERLSGLRTDESAWVTELCLTEHSSREVLPNQELARIFAQVIHKLARGRDISFLFWSDKVEVKRNLRNLDVRTEEGKALLLQLPAQELLTLGEVLKAGAFTTFFGWINGIQVTPDSPTILLESLGANDFVCVFSLYDETMEILSRLAPDDVVIPAIREVGKESGIEVISS